MIAEQLFPYITWHFIRASGPGGQHVNKTSSAVQLHFNIAQCALLSEAVKQRLRALVGNRINKQDELVISAQCFRSQVANRQDALLRLMKFIARAEHVPKPRRKTKVSKSAVRKGKQQKQQRSQKKQLRQKPEG